MKRLFSWIRPEFLFWTGFVYTCLGNILFIGLIFSRRFPVPISAIGGRKYYSISELIGLIVACSVITLPITIAVLFMARRRTFTQAIFATFSAFWMFYIVLIGYVVFFASEDSRAWTPREDMAPWPETDSTLALYEFGSLILYFSLLPTLIWRGTTFAKFSGAILLALLQFVIVYSYIVFD